MTPAEVLWREQSRHFLSYFLYLALRYKVLYEKAIIKLLRKSPNVFLRSCQAFFSKTFAMSSACQSPSFPCRDFNATFDDYYYYYYYYYYYLRQRNARIIATRLLSF